MMKNKFIILLTAVFLSTPAFAEIDDKDVQVAARTFNFIQGIPKGSLDAGLVYSPSVAGSKQAAEALHANMRTGINAGKVTIKSKLLDVTEIAASGLKVLFIMPGLEGQYDKIFSDSSKLNALTISTDFSCVAQQKCVMGVASKPNVKIEISRSAAQASGLEFAQALKLLVSEKE